MTELLVQAKTLLENNQNTCVAIGRTRVLCSRHAGILPLMTWLGRDQNALRGAVVADRVVGRAAAMLMVYGGVREVYAHVISAPAEDCFAEHGIPFYSGRRTAYIKNRAGDGQCPMELACLEIFDPGQAYEKLRGLVDTNLKTSTTVIKYR